MRVWMMLRAIPLLFILYLLFLYAANHDGKDKSKSNGRFKSIDLEPGQSDVNVDQNVNIILILADDLGYGDTSVSPFVGFGIKTPNLEKMAAHGTVMTNFHAAAATCTPTRASILTGLYPWRLGIKSVFEYGEKGKSNRDDYLPQVLTAPMVFRDNGYFTGHSGKWHIGGMREDDIAMRRLEPAPKNSVTDKGYKRCPHPGPNQQGFEEYVSVLDGPGSKRQNEYQIFNNLHSAGCELLLRNDEAIGTGSPFSLNSLGPKETLSDCEARHAIRMMKESLAHNKSFYIHLWFHAPHGPWEEIPEYRKLYAQYTRPTCNDTKSNMICEEEHKVYRARTKLGVPFTESIDYKYQTMVTSMDKSIGDVLKAVKDLGIQRKTLIVFMSDNGPEDYNGIAGSSGGYRGKKRFLYEGGIRVPAIWQWVGVIPKGRVINTFGMSTDILPTFLDAAGIPPPSHMRLDGVSLLPDLLRSHSTDHSNSYYQERQNHREILTERILLWENDYESPKSTMAWVFNFKFFLDRKNVPDQLYDMLTDPKEERNLLELLRRNVSQQDLIQPPSSHSIHRFHPTRNDFQNSAMRSSMKLHHWMVLHLYQTLVTWSSYGNEAHKIYLKENKFRDYTPSIPSDQRYVVGNPYKIVSKEQAEVIRQKLIHESSCDIKKCKCDVPAKVTDINTLPFDAIDASRQYLNPHVYKLHGNDYKSQQFLNGTMLLKLY